MMILVIPEEHRTRLVYELQQAGAREIGGVLMGEHVNGNVFRLHSLTVQPHGGTFATFVRVVSEIVAPLRRFFDATSHEYTKFNYLGEWHSHHSFELRPSSRDRTTMQELIDDAELGARMAVLLLVRLDRGDELQSSLTIFMPQKAPSTGVIHLERGSDDLGS